MVEEPVTASREVAMLNFIVNDKRCIRCGQCAADCPVNIIEQKAKTLPRIRPENEATCIQCQHCLAVCPTAAISILGHDPDLSLPLAVESFSKLEEMLRLVRGRRSVRQYRDENVDPALHRDLLTALANAPTGVNRRELTFNVIDDKAVMQRFREKTLTELQMANEAGRIPQRLAYLTNAVAAWQEQHRDVLFRTAPHALIVSAPPDAPCPQEDVALSLAYFDLLAQSAGLGTVWWGLLKSVLLMLPELKSFLGLPADHHYYGMLFGLPAVHYARTVQRNNAAQIRSVS